MLPNYAKHNTWTYFLEKMIALNILKKRGRIYIKFISIYIEIICWHFGLHGATKMSNLILTLSWQRSVSYRNQPIDLQSKQIDWFLYNKDLRHKRVERVSKKLYVIHTNKTFMKLLVEWFLYDRDFRHKRVKDF